MSEGKERGSEKEGRARKVEYVEYSTARCGRLVLKLQNTVCAVRRCVTSDVISVMSVTSPCLFSMSSTGLTRQMTLIFPWISSNLL